MPLISDYVRKKRKIKKKKMEQARDIMLGLVFESKPA
jgi:hypothetical protein